MTAALDRLTRTPDDDVIAAVLQDLWIVGVDYGRCTLRAPWAIAMPAQGPARFHHVVSGRVWLVREDEQPVCFEAGTSLLIPHGGPHVIRSDAGGSSTPLDALPMQSVGGKVYDVDFGGGGDISLLVCCSVDVGDATTGWLLASLPDLIAADAPSKTSRFNAHLVEAMAEEFRDHRAASATIMTRLADLVVAAMLRDWIERPTGPQPGWLVAMNNPRLGKAMVAMHRQPDAAWNVERLAKLAGMSRSNFADRFTELIGRTPMRFLTELRMRVAGRLLAEKRLTIGDIGRRVGYASDAAFSRAFKRVVGKTPLSVRRRSGTRSSA